MRTRWHTTGGVTYIPCTLRPDIRTCNRCRRPCLWCWEVVHNSPLYNVPESRVSNGPSAIVVLQGSFLYMRLLVHTCMQAYDSWGYVHTCTLRPDFVTCNRCRRPCLYGGVWWGCCAQLSSLQLVKRVRGPQQWLFYMQASCIYMRLLGMHMCRHTTGEGTYIPAL